MDDRLSDWVRARRDNERQMTAESAIGSGAEAWHSGQAVAFAEVLDRLEDSAVHQTGEPTAVELRREHDRPPPNPRRTMTDEQGLYTKYRVDRLDGRDQLGDKHDGCTLFVLDLNHDPHARIAASAYADACEEDRPNLACDLRVAVAALDREADPATPTTAPEGSDQ